MTSNEPTEHLLGESSRVQREESDGYLNQGNFWRDLKLTLGLMLTYDKRLEAYLRRCDQCRAEACIEYIKNAPGNKSQQLVFIYYLQKYGLFSAFVVGLLYPLIPCLIFYYLGYFFTHYDWSQNIHLYYCFEIAMLGIRCSVVTYLIRYALHFPEERFYWINYLGSILIGILLIMFQLTRNSSYGFITLYIVSIMLAYYRKTESRDSETAAREREQQKIIISEFKQLQHVPLIDGRIAIALLVVMVTVFWMLGKYADEEEYGPLVKLFVVGMMNFNQETSVFFYTLAYNSNILSLGQKYYIPNLYGFGILLPGLHLKSFFLILQGHSIKMLAFSYLALHLPSLLLMCIYSSYSDYFQSLVWRSINNTIQFVSNGLVLVTVVKMMQEEGCHFNLIIFTAVLIFTITKLYKLYEFVSALLGVFLVTSRAVVLNYSHKMPIDKFLCLGDKFN